MAGRADKVANEKLKNILAFCSYLSQEIKLNINERNDRAVSSCLQDPWSSCQSSPTLRRYVILTTNMNNPI